MTLQTARDTVDMLWHCRLLVKLQPLHDTAECLWRCRGLMILQTSHGTAYWTLQTSQDTAECHVITPGEILQSPPLQVSLWPAVLSRVCGVGSPRGNQMMRINKIPFSLRKIICCVKTTDSQALIWILNEHIEFIGDCSRILRAHFPILIKSISIFPAKQIRLYTFQECR